jgi:hypothetical protein
MMNMNLNFKKAAFGFAFATMTSLSALSQCKELKWPKLPCRYLFHPMDAL